MDKDALNSPGPLGPNPPTLIGGLAPINESLIDIYTRPRQWIELRAARPPAHLDYLYIAMIYIDLYNPKTDTAEQRGGRGLWGGALFEKIDQNLPKIGFREPPEAHLQKQRQNAIV